MFLIQQMNFYKILNIKNYVLLNIKIFMFGRHILLSSACAFDSWYGWDPEPAKVWEHCL